MGDSNHREIKTILKLGLIYIPLAFGEFVFSNIIDYLKKVKIFHRKNN